MTSSEDGFGSSATRERGFPQAASLKNILNVTIGTGDTGRGRQPAVDRTRGGKATLLAKPSGAHSRAAASHHPSRSDLTQDAQTVQPTLLEMRRLNRRSLRILAIAEESKDHDVALRAIAECRRNLELISKLTRELDPHAIGEAGGQGLVGNVVYSITKPIVEASKPVLEAAALPESVQSGQDNPA